MEKRQRFTAEFKRKAIRLMKTSTKPAAVLARELGVPRNRLYKWTQNAEKKGDLAFRGSGRPKAKHGRAERSATREHAPEGGERDLKKKRR